MFTGVQSLRAITAFHYKPRLEEGLEAWKEKLSLLEISYSSSPIPICPKETNLI